MMAIVGIVVVYVALTILSVIYSYLPNLLHIKIRREFKEKNGRRPSDEEMAVTGEINAAISAALHLYFNDMHDFENTTLTINREVKRQSPWADKQHVLYQRNVK